MFCSLRSCAIESDRVVNCWLCDSCFHIKCAALNARIFDAMNEGKGLRWSCVDCRSTDVDILKLIRQSRKGFLEVSKDLEAAQSRLAEYESLFKNFKVLDEATASPKRKRNNKNLRSSAKSTAIASPLSSNIENISPALALPPEGTLKTSVTTNQITDQLKPTNAAASASVDLTLTVPSSAVPSNDNSPSVAEKTYAQTCAANVSSSIATNTISSSPSLVSTGAIPKLISTSSNELPVHKELVVIPPAKCIFVSRFAVDTSEGDILYYLNSKLNLLNKKISVHKLRFSYQRSISSFKITLPSDLFNNVLDQGFWPVNTLVHEFIQKSQPQTSLATLPVHNMNPKN